MQHLTLFSLLFISTIANAEPLQKVVEVATLVEAHEVGGPMPPRLRWLVFQDGSVRMVDFLCIAAGA